MCGMFSNGTKVMGKSIWNAWIDDAAIIPKRSKRVNAEMLFAFLVIIGLFRGSELKTSKSGAVAPMMI